MGEYGSPVNARQTRPVQRQLEFRARRQQCRFRLSDQCIAEVGFQFQLVLGLGAVEVQIAVLGELLHLLALGQQCLDVEPHLQQRLPQIVLQLA